MNRRDRLRWRIAELWEQLVPGQCWTDVASWALRDKRTPWSPIREGCRSDLARCGSCYCGKLRAPATLPVHTGGPGHCSDCWTPPGKEHELSCSAVSLAQSEAYLHHKRADRERQDRRDRQSALAGRWVASVAALLAAALIWGWLR